MTEKLTILENLPTVPASHAMTSRSRSEPFNVVAAFLVRECRLRQLALQNYRLC